MQRRPIRPDRQLRLLPPAHCEDEVSKEHRQEVVSALAELLLDAAGLSDARDVDAEGEDEQQDHR